jgi:protein SHQ1
MFSQASEVEIDVDDTLLTVHINPYFLRLNFSHGVVEDDDSSARYDPSSGYLTVTLTKESRGQTFEDLDLLAKLLAPRVPEHHVEPTIEVIDSHDAPTTGEDEVIQRMEALGLDEERRQILEGIKADWQVIVEAE